MPATPSLLARRLVVLEFVSALVLRALVPRALDDDLSADPRIAGIVAPGLSPPVAENDELVRSTGRAVAATVRSACALPRLLTVGAARARGARRALAFAPPDVARGSNAATTLEREKPRADADPTRVLLGPAAGAADGGSAAAASSAAVSCSMVWPRQRCAASRASAWKLVEKRGANRRAVGASRGYSGAKPVILARHHSSSASASTSNMQPQPAAASGAAGAARGKAPLPSRNQYEEPEGGRGSKRGAPSPTSVAGSDTSSYPGSSTAAAECAEQHQVDLSATSFVARQDRATAPLAAGNSTSKRDRRF